jgi:hypothetical protein
MRMRVASRIDAYIDNHDSASVHVYPHACGYPMIRYSRGVFGGSASATEEPPALA